MKTISQNIASTSRLAVEQVLKESSCALSAQEISDLSGVSISITRTHLGNAINKNRAHNLNPASRGRALYVWGSQPEEFGDATPRRFVSTEPYVPTSIVTRPGALDAFALPSLSANGERIPRKLPIIIAGAQGVPKW